MAPATAENPVDFAQLLQGIPEGSWVAISNDEQRVVAYAGQMDDVLKKAHEAGESDPIVIRVPQPGTMLFL